MRRALIPLIILVIAATFAGPASGQALTGPDISGEWTSHSNEDQPSRAPGPELGDYLGYSINAAARQKAEAWDALTLSIPERQAQPHPAQYSSRGPAPNLRISKILDPNSEELIGYSFAGYYGRADRIVWLDGRPHPSEKYGEHTWGGFSTGVWKDGALVVTTTHMKMGVYQRNGIPASPYGKMTEIYFRHGNIMTMASWIDDPIYLEEPLLRTQSWEVSLSQQTTKAPMFEPVEELPDKERGWVPHFPLGTHHPEYTNRLGIPFEASLGGAETMYPEYARKLGRMAKP